MHVMARSKEKAREGRLSLIEYDRRQIMVDMLVGRIVIEPESVRFRRKSRDRGLTLVEG